MNVEFKKADEAFHAHLDVCAQCENHPFELCGTGARLLFEILKTMSPEEWSKRIKQCPGVVA
jgi:hypothetical protein